LLNRLETAKNTLMRAGAIGSVLLSTSGCADPVLPAREYVASQERLNQQPDSSGVRPTSSGLVDTGFAGEVAELNSNNFYDFAERGNRVVLFWKDTGPYGYANAYRLAVSEFSKAAEEIKYANFGRIDVAANNGIESAFNVRLQYGYIPEVLYLKDGKTIESSSVFSRFLDFSTIQDNVANKCKRFYLRNDN